MSIIIEPVMYKHFTANPSKTPPPHSSRQATGRFYNVFWIAVVLFSMVNSTVMGQVRLASSTQVPLPSPAQIAWQRAELGVIFHYDLHVFDGKSYRQSHNRITPIEDYNIFNPEHLDTDQWVRTAKEAGATFAILTVTHETGFALYQSDVSPYCLKAVKWRDGKGDILQDFVRSCRKYGILPGIYIGIRWNSFMGIYDFMMEGDSEFARNRQQYYNRLCEQMVTELVTRYGDFFFIWFDGGAHGPEEGGPDIQPIVQQYQPNAIFYHNLQRADVRWGGSESGTVPYPCWSTFNYPSFFQYRNEEKYFDWLKHGHVDGRYYMPAMADAPLRGFRGRHEWFWEPGDEAHIFPVQHLVDMYKGSIGHNATLILGLTPDAGGLMPRQDADTLAAFGRRIRELFGTPVAEWKGTVKAGKAPEFTISGGKTFHTVVVSENVENGQRVREFRIQVRRSGRWQTIAKGTAVGNKFIVGFDEAVAAKKIRLLIDRSVGEPVISRFAVY